MAARGLGGVIDAGRVAAPVIEARLHPVRGGDAGAQAFHRRLDGVLHFRAEGAHRAADARLARNHVVGLAARQETGDGEHGRVEGVEAAADHGLQGLHEGRAGDEGVASLLRHGGG